MAVTSSWHPELDTDSSSWHGAVTLRFAHSQAMTQVVHQQMQAPLKVQRPFYPEGPQICHSVILHTAGGVVGGDRLSINLQLEPHTQVLSTTAAASKIYRSSGPVAHQQVHLQLAEQAYLEWLPQETIVFEGANFHQDIQIELAPGAVWLGWDIVRFGRSARGERFLQGEWRSCTEVWRQGQPLWIDPQVLHGGEERLNSPHSLAGQSVIATLACVGQTISPEAIAKIRQCWHECDRPGEAGVSSLMEGVICRYRGPSTAAARAWFTAVWHHLRYLSRGHAPCKPRVWTL